MLCDAVVSHIPSACGLLHILFLGVPSGCIQKQVKAYAQHDTCCYLADGCVHPVEAIVCPHKVNADVRPDDGAVVTLAKILVYIAVSCLCFCMCISLWTGFFWGDCCSDTCSLCGIHMVVTLESIWPIWQPEIQDQLHAISWWHSMHAGCIGACADPDRRSQTEASLPLSP